MREAAAASAEVGDRYFRLGMEEDHQERQFFLFLLSFSTLHTCKEKFTGKHTPLFFFFFFFFPVSYFVFDY